MTFMDPESDFDLGLPHPVEAAAELPRSVDAAVEADHALTTTAMPPVIRTRFPETWLFDSFELR